MQKYNKNLPVYYIINGDMSKKYATLIGVQQGMRENNLNQCKINTIQKEEIVDHKHNNHICKICQ